MMPIPCKMNPFGKSNKPTAFELVVKPGILTTGLTYGFTPRWSSGGYCSVDWGDGQKEDATKSGTKLNHTYAVAGTYTIKIKAECSAVEFAGWSSYPIVASCSGDWDKLGNLTSGYLMFYNCTNMQIDCTSLPDGLTNGTYMFTGCKNATLPLTKLPDGLTNARQMFENCSNAVINLDTLVANAPEEGWTKLTDITNMFFGCSKVTGSRSAFRAKCPANVPGADTAFYYTNTTE